MLYQLTKTPKRIIFAYDELQSLNKISISDTGDLFGYKKNGDKLVDFSKGTYEAGIEMDYILKVSYRNPLKILMTAHSLGLGIYNKTGRMQLIDDKSVWHSIGYEVLEGDLKKTGEEIIIQRPTVNSISFANEIYTGKRKNIECVKCKTRPDEIAWVAEQIENDIKVEKVEPENIVVISLNSGLIEDLFLPLQHQLFNKGVPSIIPGIGGIERDKFGEKGFVTLSTVYKAKGNEAFIVYVMAFDYLYDYVDSITARNRAFTSISRSKGWCRITGMGDDMDNAILEIERTLENVPKFIFKVPSDSNIMKKLGQEETARRLHEKKKGKEVLKELLEIDKEAIKLSDKEREAIRKKFDL